MIRFNAKHHGNILLKYNIGYLSDFNDILYMVIWRKTIVESGIYGIFIDTE